MMTFGLLRSARIAASMLEPAEDVRLESKKMFNSQR